MVVLPWTTPPSLKPEYRDSFKLRRHFRAAFAELRFFHVPCSLFDLFRIVNLFTVTQNVYLQFPVQ